MRSVAEKGAGLGDVSCGQRHIPLLFRKAFDDGLLAESRFNGIDEL